MILCPLHPPTSKAADGYIPVWNAILRSQKPADIFRAGILVSEYFCRIARDFAHAPTTPPETAQVLMRQSGVKPQRPRRNAVQLESHKVVT